MDPVLTRLRRISLVCAGLAVVVIALAWGGLTQPLDNWAILGLRGWADRGTPMLADAMRALSWMGNAWPRSLIALAFILFLLVRKLQRAASYILYTALGIAALNSWVLKAIVTRARPDIVPRLVEVDSSWSLPSGHAANSAAVYGAMALVATVIWWRRRQRRTIWAVAGLLVFGIGLSRVWLGVHWPSDVIAGWLVGAAWATGLAVLLKPVRARVAAG